MEMSSIINKHLFCSKSFRSKRLCFCVNLLKCMFEGFHARFWQTWSTQNLRYLGFNHGCGAMKKRMVASTWNISVSNGIISKRGWNQHTSKICETTKMTRIKQTTKQHNQINPNHPLDNHETSPSCCGLRHQKWMLGVKKSSPRGSPLFVSQWQGSTCEFYLGLASCVTRQMSSSGWWLTYPSEKWWSESQKGLWHSQYMEVIMFQITNQMCVYIYIYDL